MKLSGQSPMRPISRILAAVAFLSCTATVEIAAQDVLSALDNLDGVFSDEEQSAATDSVVTEAGSVFVQTDGELILITVQSEPIGVASLCIGGNRTVHVLHASAAIGSLRYERDGADWLTGDSFDWELRDTSMSEQAIAQRAAYFDAHGWVATTSSMGSSDTIEFMASRDVATADSTFLAVGIMPSERPDSILGVPDEAGDCADGELVRGSRPERALDFPTVSWMRIDW